MKTNNYSQIAVIGLGCYYPGARSPKQLWENILSRRQQFREMPDLRLPNNDYYDPDPSAIDKTYLNKAAVLDGYKFDWLEKRIPKKTYESTDIVHWLALDTALQAIIDAGFDKDSIQHDKTGVILGNTLTGEFTRSNTMLLRWPYVRKVLRASLKQKGLLQFLDSIEGTMEDYYKSAFAPVTEDTLAGGLANTIAGRICNYLDLHGGGYIVDGACSSSILAICTAANYLESGQMDMVIAGGVDISLDTFELVGFAKTGALTRDEMRVYDKQGKGFIPGEGCGMVILKRLEDAVKNNDQIYAIINGWGISSDGKGGITAPSATGQCMALLRAYEKCGFDTEKLSFIEGHGTGTTVGDKTELEGITLALNHKKKIPYRNCGVTSFKSIVGHTKAAAGVGAFIKTVIALNRRILPPTAGLREFNPIFDEFANTIYPITQGQIKESSSILYAGVSAMGFGGINSHVLLQSADPPSSKLQPSVEERKLLVSDQTSEVFLITAVNLHELTEQIEKLLTECKGISYAEIADLAFHHNSNPDNQKIYRAGIVASSPADLERKLNVLKNEVLKSDLEKINSLENDTIVFGRKKENLRIGALFPGQGSQQINMTFKLHERFDWARNLLIAASDILQKETPENILDAIYKITDRFRDKNEEKEWKSILTKTYVAQPAIIFASLLWKRYLERLGINFSCASGHSLGELTAFHTAAMLDEETLIRFAAFRGKSMYNCGSGTMASLVCPVEKAEEYIKSVPGYVTIANINAPEQTIISGDTESIAFIIKKAEQEHIAAIELPVSAAFHSKLISKTANEIENYDLIKNKNTQKTGFKLVSSVTGKIIPDNILLNQYFSTQAISQVNFINAIHCIKSECDILIEVGPGKVLSGLTASITNDIKCFPVEAKVKDENSFNTMLANIFVYGANLNISEIYEGRLLREFIPASKKEFIVNPLERPIQGLTDTTSANNEGINQFINHLELSEDTFKDYILKRGGFIKEVIQADLKHLNITNTSLSQDTETIVPAKNPVRPQPVIDKKEVNSQKNVKETVFGLVSEKTGFPADQLSPSFRLLNDLNLDSIKAGSILAELIKKYQLQGKLEHAKYSDASLDEITEAIENLIQSPSDNNHCPSESRTPANMVESFCAEIAEETISDLPLVMDSRKFNKAGIVYCNFDRKKQNYFSGEIMNIAEDVVYIEHHNLSSFKNPVDTILVFIPETGNDLKNLNEIISLFSNVAAFSAGKQAEIAFIQWGEGYFSLNNKKVTKNIFSATAFASSLHLERPSQKIRILEFFPGIPLKQLVQFILKEFSTNEAFAASAYPSCEKKIKKVFEINSKSPKSKRNITPNSGDVFVVTGGAKGITMECAFAFANKYQCKMALVGSSVLNNEIQRILDRYANKKLIAKYYSCNITDNSSVAGLIQTIGKELGNTSGIIHGAGINIPRKAEDVTAHDALAEIGPKLIGAFNLVDATRNLNLKYFIALTSIIGVTGMKGNCWYAFSNEALDLLLRNIAGKNLETITYAYSVWNQIGMGERMGSTKLLENLGIGSISPEQGISEFIKWTENKAPDQQVIIAAGLGHLDTWKHKVHLKPLANRYLEKIILYEHGREIIAQSTLNRDIDKYANDHNYHDSLLLPTVFGLEAMAQSASMLCGIYRFNSITIENISLLHPIMIPNKGNITIQIKATAKEEDSGWRILTGISTEDTDFATDHFSAEFVFNSMEKPKKHTVNTPENFLSIEPKSDLYSWLLFQGELFQNIDKVYQLNSKTVVFSTTKFDSDTSEICFSPGKNTPFILGSPLLRDVLLQSGQLILTQNEYLPVYIKKWVIYNINKQKEGGIIECNLLKENEKSAICEVVFTNSNKEIIESIKGYEVKKLKPTDKHPLPEAIADISAVYTDKLRSSLKLFENDIALDFDVVLFKHFQQFNLIGKQVRHEIEESVFKRLYLHENNFKLSENLNSLIWDERGKPWIKGSNVDISITHSKSLLMMSIGKAKQGCDIEFVEQRDTSEWLNLIPQKQHKILTELEKSDKSIHIAATRIWSVNEALLKADNSELHEIHVERIINDAVIFKTRRRSKTLYIITIPISFLPNNTFIVAFITEIKNHSFVPAKQDFTDDHELFDAATGRLITHFNTSFKDCSGFFGKTHFTNYAGWMGKLREHVLSPIGKQLIKDLSTGKFGMVTNLSRIKIFNETEALNKIIGTINITHQSDLEKSYIDLAFEWFKENENGDWIKLAETDLSTTWVKIEGHGIVKQAPLPDYFYTFLSKYIHKELNTAPIGISEHYLTRKDLGFLVYKSASKPRPEILIDRRIFQTSMYDSNSVGNLYYSNYYDWQAKMLESSLFKISPEIFIENGKSGEYICLESSVSHLQEAMPFEEIEVSMYIDEIYRSGARIYFEYYSTSRNNRRKLAYGKLLFVWTKREDEKSLPESRTFRVFHDKFLRNTLRKDIFEVD